MLKGHAPSRIHQRDIHRADLRGIATHWEAHSHLKRAPGLRRSEIRPELWAEVGGQGSRLDDVASQVVKLEQHRARGISVVVAQTCTSKAPARRVEVAVSTSIGAAGIVNAAEAFPLTLALVEMLKLILPEVVPI